MENELQLVDDQRGAALPAVQPSPRASGSTPADLIIYAMESGADLDRLERLMDMQIAWEKREAEKAFAQAMAEFQRVAPRIIKNKTADFPTSKGRTTYDYATLGNVVATISEKMGEHGFSRRWVPDQSTPGKITVTCIITHKLGHSESSTLSAKHDDTGGKNDIQGMGSARSYLERYTLLDACGMAVEDGSDDDGKSFGRADVDTSLSDEWIAKVKEAKTDKDVLAVWSAGAAKLEKHPRDFEDFQRAVAERRGEINNPPQQEQKQ